MQAFLAQSAKHADLSGPGLQSSLVVHRILHNTESAIDTGKMVLLTEFAYDVEKSNVRTYDILDSAASAVVDTVRLDFASNHGNPSHTCIYRLRVHGYEPNSVSMMANDVLIYLVLGWIWVNFLVIFKFV